MRFPSIFRSPRARTESGAVPAATAVASSNKRAARAILPAIVGLGVLSLCVLGLRAQNSAPPTIAVSRHALNNNGRIEGSAQQLLGENININGGAYFGGDLLVPGNPKVKINGHPNWKGQRNGGGSNSPSNYQVSINSSVDLGYLVTQSDPIALDNVATPPNPRGTRNVNINSAGDVAAVGAWSSVRDLNLNGNVDIAVPAGTYGNFNLNNGAVVLGTQGDTSPDVYNFQNMNFNGSSRLKVVGPVVVTIRNGLNVNSVLGSSQNQSWLQLNISDGGLNLNSNAVIYGAVRAPNGSVNINGTLWGSVQADRLNVNGGGVIKLGAIVQPTPIPTAVPTATPIPTATPKPAPTATPIPTAIPVPTPTGAPLATVTPITECVESLGGGQYRARFGTNVPGPTAQIIPVGTTTGNENKFSPAPIDRDQPTAFLPGRTVNSFQVNFSGSTTLTWTLRGQSVTASANSNGCPVPTPTPTLAPTATPVPAPTATPIPAPTATPVPLPTATPVPLPTATPVPLPTATPVPLPTATPIPAPTATPIPLPTATPTPVPTATPIPNQPPVAVDDAQFVKRNGSVRFELLGFDDDGDDLTYRIISGPDNGTVTPVAGVPNTFTYAPNRNFVGNDMLQFVANDGQADSDPATVAFIVQASNAAPVGAPDAYATDEDTRLSVPAPGVLGNDTDADGDPLTAILVDAPAHGTIQFGANGAFNYVPAANYNGVDSFNYRVSDGTAQSAVVRVAITVNPVNDAPVAAADNYAVNQDDVLTVAKPGVLSNDSDVDGDALTAQLVADPTHGTLNLNANGRVRYTPDAGFSGADSFTYRANDGTLNSNVATVAITVNAVNHAPVGAPDAYATDEDTPLKILRPAFWAMTPTAMRATF